MNNQLITILDYAKSLLLSFLLIAFSTLNANWHEDLIIPQSHSVNILTGEYVDKQSDVTINGKNPVIVERCYTSNKHNRLLTPYGWTFNLPALCGSTTENESLRDSKYVYEYDANRRLIRMEEKTASGQPGASISIAYANDNNGKIIATILGNDGQTAQYKYHYNSASRNNKELILDEVILNEKTSWLFDYVPHPIERSLLLSRKKANNGRWLQINYFGTDSKDVGKVKNIFTFSPENPSENLLAAFEYENQKTIVYDELGNKTEYIIQNDLHIKAITSYQKERDGSFLLLRTEHFFWMLSEIGQPALLKSKAISDPFGNMLVCRSYEYGLDGELLKETIWGNLSGDCETSLQIDEDGNPIENGVENYSIHYRYSNDGSLKLLEKEEDNGSVVKYNYTDDISQPVMKRIFDGKTCVRHFNGYDKNGLLVSSTIDDGTSEDPNDLTGVTESKFFNYTVSCERRTWGKLLICEEYAHDIKNDKKLLIKRTVLTYDECGRKAAETMFDGSNHVIQNVEYVYNTMDNIVMEIVSDDSKVIKTIQRLYDSSNRIVTELISCNEGSTQKSMRYGTSNSYVDVTDECGNCIKYSYDALGRLINVEYPSIRNVDGGELKIKKRFEYDALNRVVLEKDAKGYATTKLYNAYGNPIHISYPDGSNEKNKYLCNGILQQHWRKNGNSTLINTDGFGRTLKSSYFASNGDAMGYIEAKNNAFHVLTEKNSNDIITAYEYDYSGFCTAKTLSLQKNNVYHTCCPLTMGSIHEKTDDGASILDSFWNGTKENIEHRIQNAFDAKGNKQSAAVVNERGQVILELSENNQGKEKKTSSILHSSESIVSNSIGQQVVQRKFTDINGNSTTTTYNACGEKETIIKTDCMGCQQLSVEFHYDAALNVINETWKTEFSEITYARSYGPENRLEKAAEYISTPTLKQVRETSYAYNTVGQLIHITKPDSTVLTLEYDHAGRIAHLSADDGSIDYHYEYNSQGKVCSYFDAHTNCKLIREFSPWGYVLSESSPNGLHIQYSYDGLGRKTSITLPDGSAIAYVYDEAFMRKIMRLDNEGIVKYTHCYDEWSLKGNLLKAQLPCSLGALQRSYDDLGRVVSQSTPYASYSWVYQEKINASKVVKSHIEDALGSNDVEYTYNDAGHLIEEKGDVDGLYHCDYLLFRMQTDSNSYCSYDSCGRLAYKRTEKGEWKFYYDALDRLRSVEDCSRRCVINYAYDPCGRRISKKIELLDDDKQQIIQELNFLYDGDSEIAAFDKNGNCKALRILGHGINADIGSNVAMELSGKLYVPIHDLHGSVAALIDAELNEIAQTYRYSSFGEVSSYDADGYLIANEDCLSPWLYSSKRFDKETGLIFFGKRYYDPLNGAWITPDPIGSVDGPNRYGYVHNSPIDNVDSFGHFTVPSACQGILNIGFDFLKHLFYAINEPFQEYKHEYGYIESKQTDIDLMMNQMIGRGYLQFAGYYVDRKQQGIWGNGDLNSKIRITFINGMLNSRFDLSDAVKLLSKTHGGANIHYLFRPTEGWTKDLISCFMAKLGYKSTYATTLAAQWKGLIQEMGGVGQGGLIIHYAHSIGATETKAAMSLLSEEEQKMLRIITLGSPSLIHETSCDGVVNYASENDFIPLLDPIRYFQGVFTDQSNIIFLQDEKGIPFIDHLLIGSTYRKILETLGRSFLDEFGS